MLSRILEISFTLIMIYLVLSQADNFSTVIKSAGDIYIKAVKTLQGR